MRLKHYLIAFIFSINYSFAQEGKVIFIGHNFFNDQALPNVSIRVVESGKTIQTLTTSVSPDFKLMLPFGKNYSVYFEHPRIQPVYLKVMAENIPQKLYNVEMKHDFRIPHFPKDALTFDTTQFRNPFYKVIFNGKDGMIDDTMYTKQFISKLYLKKEEKKEVKQAPPVKLTNLAGKFNYSNSEKTPVIAKKVYLLNAKGEVIKTTSTNKFGTFIFTGVNLNEAVKVEIDFKKEFTDQKLNVELTNTKRESLGINPVAGNKAGWQNSAQNNVIEKLVDPRFTYKIAAKLIAEEGKKSTFYSGKTVFLLNDKNTIVKRTKTNALGSFVFTEVKPGNLYLIGIDKNEAPMLGKVNLHSNREHYLCPVDSFVPGRYVRRFSAENNILFNEMLIDDSQLKMDVTGKLFAENSNNPLSDLKILLLNDKFEPIDTTTTDGFGKFAFRYLPYDPNYMISAFSDNEAILEAINNIHIYSSADEMIKVVTMVKGRRFNYKPLSADQSRLTEVYADDPWLSLMTDFDSKKVKPVLIIEDIFFESNKSELLPDAERTLDKVALIMNSNQKLKIELGAHTDSNGPDAANQTLSDQRAKAASDYVISKGIESSRIVTKGYGETRIINRCKNGVFCADDEHRQNRRIEFRILKN
jgi:outer membrane protein OmpA-like peptidoglycan-associated protein